MLPVVITGELIHQVPRGRQRIVQRIEQRLAVTHLVDNLEMLLYDFAALSEKTVICDCGLHFIFYHTDAVEIFKVIDDIEDDRFGSFPGRQGTSYLLFIYNRGYGRTQQHNA